MTSKSSFWKLSIWNFKKRLWSFALCAAIWFVLLPVAVFVRTGSYLEEYGIAMTAQNIEWVRYLIVYSNIAGRGMYSIVSIGMAMLLALHGFSWNNHQSKVDLFQAVPVKAAMRFCYIHLNSLWIFAVSFGVNMLLANAAAAVKGIWYGGFLKASILSFFLHLLLFLSVYFLTVIAQSLTGNIILGLFGADF